MINLIFNKNKVILINHLIRLKCTLIHLFKKLIFQH